MDRDRRVVERGKIQQHLSDLGGISPFFLETGRKPFPSSDCRFVRSVSFSLRRGAQKLRSEDIYGARRMLFVEVAFFLPNYDIA